MTREQYDEQKRRLAEQHRSLIEMLASAHQTQLQALDMVWRMLSGEGGEGGAVPGPAPAAKDAAPRPAAPAPPPRRRQPHQLYGEVLALLPRLPEAFTMLDVCEGLGYAPNRGSLYRALQDLKGLGRLTVQFPGSGTQPTQYRKLPTEPAARDIDL